MIYNAAFGNYMLARSDLKTLEGRRNSRLHCNDLLHTLRELHPPSPAAHQHSICRTGVIQHLHPLPWLQPSPPTTDPVITTPVSPPSLPHPSFQTLSTALPPPEMHEVLSHHLINVDSQIMDSDNPHHSHVQDSSSPNRTSQLGTLNPLVTCNKVVHFPIPGLPSLKFLPLVKSHKGIQQHDHSSGRASLISSESYSDTFGQ
ncbi:hypothetical protein E1B28_000356 [Marasmius oreades]|uniref:Uncharacterized protein n=1 Tax=Marasmius oreades TaxID=181124 RepID=A0A9P8AE92_9AGAR|nr:uncharacterized protein E1B28_000356 [Marasmius oreades]KAG7098397.1 hypothetical protein E1B28_000356 [Marasmius oreades]